MATIHGHEVIEMIQVADRPFRKEELVGAIAERFGADARFHTCSAEDLSGGELVEFLMARGKFTVADEGMTLDPEQVCRH